jgi:hypothetical protein
MDGAVLVDRTMAVLGGFAVGCAVVSFTALVVLVVMVTFGIHEVPNWFAGVWFLLGCAVWFVAYRQIWKHS